MDLAEDAIKFAIFLVDADRLFDVALGMYDFSLVLMVAQQSQKDPREYLPFLTELESYPKYYQQFKIDDHLCRYEKALRNLNLAGDEYFDDCLKYIREHELYNSAISIFANNNEKYKVIMAIYGHYLFTESKFKEAGLGINDKPKALDSYKNCGSWHEAFAIAQELNSSSDSLSVLAKSLSETLSDKRQYQEAAQIILDYTKQPEESIILLNKDSDLYQNEESIENADVFSDTSSMASGFTRYTLSNTQL
ncbi:2621_t:CDS:2, partial [Scutellospora calospora]